MLHSLPRATAAVVLALSAFPASAFLVSIAGVDFDTDNATTTAAITGGGYVTPFGTALHSGTSPDWTDAPPSLGTHFQIPTWQPGYDPAVPVTGQAGSAVTLGQDYRFPETSLNPRDIIQLGWDSGNGLANGTGNDLAIFEAATSEAFAIRVHSTASGGYWTGWYYSPYWELDPRPQSAIDNDTTASLFDLDELGLAAGEVINAIEITNLLLGDTVDEVIDDITDHALVYFGGSTIPGQDNLPLRFSTSLGVFVPFEDRKYDPDLQYVVSLHDITVGGVSGTVSALNTGLGPSAPARFPPTGPTPSVPEPGVPALLAAGLWLLARRRRGDA